MEEKKYILMPVGEFYAIVTKDFIIEHDYFLFGADIIMNTSMMTDEICKTPQLKVIATNDPYFNKIPKIDVDYLEYILYKTENYTQQDMVNACKYGYEFHKTSSFPEHNFEQACINNFKAKLASDKIFQVFLAMDWNDETRVCIKNNMVTIRSYKKL